MLCYRPDVVISMSPTFVKKYNKFVPGPVYEFFRFFQDELTKAIQRSHEAQGQSQETSN